MIINSILTSTKEALGILPEHTFYDNQITMHINSVFTILNQLKVGPEEGYQIESEEDLWTDFIVDSKRVNAVKSYMFLRVKLMFDPPQMGYLVDSIRKQCDELEWRLNVQVDPGLAVS